MEGRSGDLQPRRSTAGSRVVLLRQGTGLLAEDARLSVAVPRLYVPVFAFTMVGDAGFEPATSAMSTLRSNQLS
jgi:hypothetical protein